MKAKNVLTLLLCMSMMLACESDDETSTTGGDSGYGGQVAGTDTSGGTSNMNNGGESSGGEVSGGEVSGGEVSGGEVVGGEVVGGEVAGGEVAGGEVAGGEVAGGEVVNCEFESCGGDLTGLWSIDRFCIQTPEILNPFEECPEATMDMNMSATGMITFGDDGTFSRASQLDGILTINIPADCIPAEVTCELFGDSVAMGDPANGDPAGVASCEQADDVSPCDCTISYEGTLEEESGTYEVTENNVTLTSGDEDSEGPETLTFCVQDDALTLQIDDAEEDAFTIYLTR